MTASCACLKGELLPDWHAFAGTAYRCQANAMEQLLWDCNEPKPWLFIHPGSPEGSLWLRNIGMAWAPQNRSEAALRTTWQSFPSWQVSLGRERVALIQLCFFLVSC